MIAATSHLFEPMQSFSRLRLNMATESVYVNSGVMLFNLDQLRKVQSVEQVARYILENKRRLILFDQDILNGLYSEHTLSVSPLLYNMDEKFFKAYNLHCTKSRSRIDYEWVRENSVIIHFCGKNKPWREDYKGQFGKLFYEKYAEKIV